MKNTTKRLGLVAAALLLAAIAAQPVLASCSPVAAPISTRANSTDFSFIHQSGWGGQTFAGLPYDSFPSLDNASLFGVFWAIGTGNPTVGAGDDNGSFGPTGWLAAREYPSVSFFYGTEIPIGTGWGTNSGIDGCITANPSRCTCVLLSQNGGPAGAQFVLFSAQADAGASTLFNQPGNAALEMAPIPVPNITDSVRDATTFDLTLDVLVPAATGGVYEDLTNCPQTCGLKYRIKEYVRPRGQVGSPADQDAVSYTDVTDFADTDLGAPALGVRSLCGSQDNDVWFATQLVTDDGFVTPYVSAPSTKIECGPTLADPDPKKKPFPVRKQIERGERGGRSGR